MYFWNKKALEEKLIADSLTEREKFSYLFALTFAWLLGGTLSLFFLREVSDLMIIGQATGIVLSAIGIIWCFQINQAGDGKNFLERFICLSWIMSVKILVIYFAFLFAISIILNLAYPEQYQESLSGPSIIWDILVGGVLTIICYWRLAVSIAVIANAKRRFNELD